MNKELLFITFSLICYSLVSLNIFRKFIFKKISLILGILFQFSSLTIRVFYSKHVPFADLYESINFFSLCIFLTLFLNINFNNLSKETSLIGLIFIILSLIFYRNPSQLPELLRNNWFLIHAPSCFLSYGFFTTAFVSAIKLLFSKENNKLEILLYLINENIKISFPLLTVGILTGSLWAKVAWGSYWNWDPKETSSLVLWIIFLFYFHLSNRKNWQNKKIALVVILGFILVLFTFLGLNLIPIKSMHTYNPN